MQKGGTVNDYTVTIGQGLCENLQLSTNSLHCKPPKKEPNPGAGNPGKGRLRVYVGFCDVIMGQSLTMT